jgi:ubiquinone/menaquinone biosynthesis C-methylase UbiE
MPTTAQNYRVWDQDHSWRLDGDEWHDQADFCGQPYDAWKRSLFEEFMARYITNTSHVLEIGPGHGRWTKLYIESVRHVSLVDLSPSCIDHCKRLFNSFDHVDYFVNDGASLRSIAEQTIDFIWSYDVFVHIEREEFKRYLAEFARILKIGGVAVIHHPNTPHSSRFFTKFFLVNMTGPLRFKIADYLFGRSGNMGRSSISGRMVRSMAENSGLQPVIQTATWGPNHEYNCLKFNDQISVVKKA